MNKHPWSRTRRLAHRYVLPITSRLPDRTIKFLERHWQLWRDPADGWTFWTDSSYHRWVREDRKRNAGVSAPQGSDVA